MSFDAAVVDYSAGLLLRYFRTGGGLGADTPRLEHRRDIEILKGHWSLSEPVRELVRYLLERPYEAQALLAYNERIDDAMARGRIDARKTWMYRQQSGLPSALVTLEPVRSFNTGPNKLLAWVLREAASYTSRLLTWQGPTSAYLPALERAQTEMRKVQRIGALREPLRAVALGERPNAGAIRDASRSRRHVYRLAVEAYQVLQGLERGERAAMDRVARSAIIGPLEDWRRFELAVGLAVGEALGRAVDAPARLQILAGDSARPIVTVGKYDIYWQQITEYHSPATLEPSEVAARAALSDYGINLGTERPDIVVADRQLGRVVAVVEVKYVAGDTVTARFREAVDQLVRYGRSYASPSERDALLSRSLVAISRSAPSRIANAAAAPFATDFDSLRQPHGLDAWAVTLAAAS